MYDYDPVMADLERYLSKIEEGERLDEAAYKLQEDEDWVAEVIEEFDLDPNEEDFDEELHEIACEEVQRRARNEEECYG